MAMLEASRGGAAGKVQPGYVRASSPVLVTMPPHDKSYIKKMASTDSEASSSWPQSFDIEPQRSLQAIPEVGSRREEGKGKMKAVTTLAGSPEDVIAYVRTFKK